MSKSFCLSCGTLANPCVGYIWVNRNLRFHCTAQCICVYPVVAVLCLHCKSCTYSTTDQNEEGCSTQASLVLSYSLTNKEHIEWYKTSGGVLCFMDHKHNIWDHMVPVAAALIHLSVQHPL